jgi:GAF domain
MREACRFFVRVRELGLQCGDLFHAILAYAANAAMLFRIGEPLETVLEEIGRGFATARRFRYSDVIAYFQCLQQVIRCLQGGTRLPTSLSNDAFDEDTWVSSLNAIELRPVQHYYYLWKMEVLFLHGDFAGARAMMECAERVDYSRGHYYITLLPFYAALILSALYPMASVEEKPCMWEAIERHHAKLAAYADACPENMRHQQMLVAAEIARIERNSSSAIDSYEQAIALAERHGLPHVALANELCAKFYAARGQVKVARVYMIEAHHGYVRWGANVKALQLEECYPSLLLDARAASQAGSTGVKITGQSSTSPSKTNMLDVIAAPHTSAATSSRMVLDKLMLRVMHIVLANAGAERGFLILMQKDVLEVEAIFQISPDTIEIGLDSAVESRKDIAKSVVHFVARTTEPVVLNDADHDPRFASDSYIVAARPKSLLCIPLMEKAHLRGVLYLENKALHNAFTEERIEIVEMICTQMSSTG